MEILYNTLGSGNGILGGGNLSYNQIDAYKQYTMWCSCILQCAIVYYSYTSLCTIISDVMYV